MIAEMIDSASAPLTFGAKMVNTLLLPELREMLADENQAELSGVLCSFESRSYRRIHGGSFGP